MKRTAQMFNYTKWRHGGWYVPGIQYASGAVGCVSNNYPDRKWRIVCDEREPQPTFATRDEAAAAEYALAQAETAADGGLELERAAAAIGG